MKLAGMLKMPAHMMHDLRVILFLSSVWEKYFPHKFEPGTLDEESIINKLMAENKDMTYKKLSLYSIMV